MLVEIYSLPVCPNCEQIKDLFKSNNIEYVEHDLEDDDIRMNLLMDCVTLVEAPIIKINDKYYSSDSATKELNLNV